MVNFLNELKMVYYIVHGWFLPSEKTEENLTQNLINMASDSHEEGVRERGESK